MFLDQEALLGREGFRYGMGAVYELAMVLVTPHCGRSGGAEVKCLILGLMLRAQIEGSYRVVPNP